MCQSELIRLCAAQMFSSVTLILSCCWWGWIFTVSSLQKKVSFVNKTPASLKMFAHNIVFRVPWHFGRINVFCGTSCHNDALHSGELHISWMNYTSAYSVIVLLMKWKTCITSPGEGFTSVSPPLSADGHSVLHPFTQPLEINSSSYLIHLVWKKVIVN